MSTTQAIVCKTCPAGRYGDVTALECASFCVKQCKGCVTGRYSAEKGVKADTACLKCSQGTFSEVDGRSSLQDCKLCRQGTNFNNSFLLSHVYIFMFSYLKKYLSTFHQHVLLLPYAERYFQKKENCTNFFIFFFLRYVQ